MKTFFNSLQQHIWCRIFTIVLLLPVSAEILSSQCTLSAGTIKGKVFIDYNNDGALSTDDDGYSGVTVSIFDEHNNKRGSVITSSDGSYSIDGLKDNNLYRVQFQYNTEFSSSRLGVDNNSSVQFIEAPACNVSFGLVTNSNGCGSNPDMIATCFVQGSGTTNQNIETIIGFEHDFNLNSSVKKYATHGETGSVWGIAWKSSTSQIFSSAFVKQYSGLKAGLGAIFVTKVKPNSNATEVYTDLSTKVNVGSLSVSDVTNCNYGSQVGKIGLGNMILSNDEQYLYVTNLFTKSIVKVSTTNPNDVTEFNIPDPGCSNGDYAVFALKHYNDKFYIGVTCTAQTSRSSADSKAIVYEWDESDPTVFNNVFETSYLKGFWYDTPADRINTAHWFTDIEFSDDDHMIIGFSDRVGHRYCNNVTNRLDVQAPDILMVYKNKDGKWTLESNGKTDNFIGSGQGNGQGPGGGEFFGFDFWPASESLHPETALGSFYIYPGSGEIIAMVYDPDKNAYSGGLHRYDTKTGALNGAKELYVRNPTTLFGKATGFGDVTSKCVKSNIQIGNFVWFDDNGNGIQDANESPAVGLAINLLDENCQVLASTVTDNSGNYIFENVVGGVNYYIALPENVLDEVGLVNIGNETYIFTDADTSDDILDSDAAVLDIDCDNVIIPVQVGFTNHTFDIGLKEATGFDLALNKIVLDNSIAHLNETIPFRITVYNQGGIPAKNISIVDYIPEGYEFLDAENEDWTYNNGKAYYTFPETIFPGASDQVNIYLKLISTDLNKIVNVSEIFNATDHNDKVVEDDDSTMDDNPDNDEGGQVGSANDDNINDDGTFDEDDSDPAIPQIFDLALSQYYEDNDCVTGGSEIIVKTSVFNQGNVPSKSFEVTNYGSPLLNFDKNKNPGWNVINGLYVYEGKFIAPGTKFSVDLIFDVINSSQDIEVVNYAEISSSIPEGRNVSEDSDSTPDNIENNDKGGTPNSNEDNFINGSPDVEEDDHDPIVIHPRIVDLALKITSESNVVQTGDEVCFDITVYNQGFMPIKAISLADYIPNGLSMIPNQGWEWSYNNVYTKHILFDNNLAPNAEHKEQVCFTVGDLTGIYSIANFAEISSITGICGEDLSLKDRDSKADDIDDNDEGGKPFTDTDDSIDMFPAIDEDDHDVALLINVKSTIINECEYKCPATEPGNGVILSTIQLDAPSGMTWRIDQGIGYFDESSTAGNLVPLTIGEILTESPGANPSESKYTFTGAFSSGKPYTARFKSDNNDFVYVESGAVCSYKTFPVTGPIALCTSGIATYTVGDNSGDVYNITFTGGGNEINSTNNSITIDWNGTMGDHEIRFVNDSDCTVEPILYNVVTGSTDNAMKCKSSTNLSIDADCEVEITPEHIIAGNPVPDAAYAVMLTLNDKPIPGNIVNASHIGKTVMAKLIEGCGGNSCWGTILIEDKIAPIVTCEDVVTVACYKAAQYTGPVAIDNCGNPVTLHLLDSTYTKIQCDDITGFFLKSYQAEDQSGNLSKICQQRIDVLRVNLDSIKFPGNMTMLTALACNDYLKDANGNPDPSITGVPMLEGDPLFPNFDNFCNLIATYTDEGPYPFECANKIIRTWTIWDESCFSKPISRSEEQTIVIGDKSPPTITCPEPSTASTGFANCEAKFRVLPATNLTDDCTVDLQVDITYPGGFKIDQNGGFDIFLAAGKHTITYRAIDDCKRSSSCTTTVNVADNSAPLAVCDKNTTVALTSQGEAYIYAQTIDDGSYDACGLSNMLVKRDDNGAACGQNVSEFAPTVDFCCDDVSNTDPVIVILQVTDLEGNSNTCSVNVFVQDKTKPVIKCPDNQTISCLDHYDINDLSEFGKEEVEDACGIDTVLVQVIENVSSCRVGFIDRIFIATDGSNTDTCTQRITIEKDGIFDFNDIKWPRDTIIENACVSGGINPKDLDIPNREPIVDDGICDMISFAHKDKMYQFNNDTLGTCFKIIRRWTVINHCDTIDKRDPNNIKFREEDYDQVIKVSKTQGPTFTSDLSDKSAFLNINSCDEGYIILEAAAEGCLIDEEIEWSYQVFLNGANTPEPRVSGDGDIADASGDYPLGKHVIQWSFSDFCGNTTTRSQNFSIIDNKKPTPVCLDSVSVALVAMDLNDDDTLDTEMACIWPDNLNRSSSHTCYPPELLEYSFNEFNTLDSLCFNCFNIGPNTVDLYVIDPDGNFDICKVTVVIQDTNNDDFCPTLEDCITWPADVELDCNETLASIDTSMSKPTIDPTCACTEFDLSFVDTPVASYLEPICATFTRTWTLTFMCGQDQVFDYAQTIIQFNENLPVFSCPGDVTVSVDMGSCEANVMLAELMFSDTTCNTGVEVTNSINGNGANASGIYAMSGSPHEVVFTVFDDCNSDTCSTFITVVDSIAPLIGNCLPLQIDLDPNGKYMLDIEDFIMIAPNAMDNCVDQTALAFYTLDRDTFNCLDIDENIMITVFVEAGGLLDSCTANITVEDNLMPTAICNNITRALDADGQYELTDQDLIILGGSSTDNCSIELDVNKDEFECQDDIGANNVLVTVSDNNGQEDTCTAIVTLIDTIAPIAICNDITVSLDSLGMYTLTAQDELDIAFGSTDACGFASLDAQPDDFTCLDVGEKTVLLTIVDVNSNMDTCSATVNVMDDIAPIASCNDITINVVAGGVQLSMQDSLDLIAGSMDACGFTVDITPNIFLCADTSAAVEVTVTLTDPSSNVSVCTADVTVVSTDTLMCVTNNLTVFLSETGCFVLDINDIDGGSGAGCEVAIMREIDVDSVCCNDAALTGMNIPTEVTLTVFVPGVDTATCISLVSVFDTLAPMITCLDTMINCDLFDGDFEAIDQYDINDNCMNVGVIVDTLSTTTAINNCNQGSFLREFMVTDVGGNTDVCTVAIQITGPANPVTLMDFSLPQDTVIVDNCTSTDTSITGMVTIDNDTLDCEYFEISFSDNPATPLGMCSDTIIRTWMMMDTCNNNDLMYEQVIIVVDTIAPVLSASTDTVFVANPNQECELFVGLDTVITVADCNLSTVSVTNNGSFADNMNSDDASGTYPGGNYTITVIATDSCGNADTLSYVLSIEIAEYDFFCDKGIEEIDSITLMACFPVSDIAQLNGACDTVYNIKIQDETTGIFYEETDTVKLGCDRLGDNVFLVYLFQDTTVFDSCTVRSDVGRTLLTVNDTDGNCPTPIGKVSGKVLTINTLPIADVKMNLEGSGLEYQMTNIDGEYAFPEMAAGGNYMVKPYKDDDVLSGVSTLDLILIQRHLLKIDPLGSTYDVVAADVNNDNRLTVSDLVDLRRTLLGFQANFSNNTSWKMIDAAYQFPVYMDPFAENYPLEYEINPLQGNRIIDFIGVKIGDVDGSYKPNSRSADLDSRSAVNMSIVDRLVSSNQETDLRIGFNGIDEAFGLQTSIEIDGLSKIVGVASTTDRVVLDYNIVGQTILISAYSDQLIDMNEFEILISFESNVSKSLSDIVTLNKSTLSNEIYTEHLQTKGIDLLWETTNIPSSVITIAQNKPNPWNDKTFVEVNLSEDKEFTLSVIDLTGRMIHQKLISGKKGMNKVELTDADVDYATGVFIVIFDADGSVVKQRMIRIN